MKYRPAGRVVLLGVAALGLALMGLFFLALGRNDDDPAGVIVLALMMFGMAAFVVQRACVMRVEVAGDELLVVEFIGGGSRTSLGDIREFGVQRMDGTPGRSTVARLRNGGLIWLMSAGGGRRQRLEAMAAELNALLDQRYGPGRFAEIPAVERMVTRWYVADPVNECFYSRAERWFWGGSDIVLVVCLLGLAALDWDDNPLRAQLCLLGAPLAVFLAIRGFRLALCLEGGVLVDRGYLWTRRIPLADLASVSLETREGATAPVLAAESRDGRTRTLGQFGFIVPDAAAFADFLQVTAAHVTRRLER